ncbi:MAG: TfoX/Sxy family protein [Nitrospiraceae bacterium]
MTTARDAFAEFVSDQLADLRGLLCRRMFGGHGLYVRDRFIGIVHKGRLYFKVSDDTRATYVAQGMKPFRPSPTQTLRSFYEVPVDILEQQDLLLSWAEAACAAAKEAAATRRTSKPTSKRPSRRASPASGPTRRTTARKK